MQITINGAGHETNAPTVEVLVAELGLKRGTVLIEHNGVALRPDEWPQRAVQSGDGFEILRIVAGG
jgi:sulfur carrier protein